MTAESKHGSINSTVPSDGKLPVNVNWLDVITSKFLHFTKKLGDQLSLKNKLNIHDIKQPNLVLGRDDRVMVEHPSYQVPFRHICFLKSEFGDGIIREGTGWLAGPRLLVTAAHVVHRTGQVANKPISVSIIPALDGEGREPYGRVTVYSDAIHLPVNDPVEGSPDDYAVIVLPSETTAGWFGLKILDCSIRTMDDVKISGYPDNGVLLKDIKYEKRQLSCAGSVSCNEFFLTYKIDTTSGQSGSPVWIDENGKIGMVVGIHVQGTANGNQAIRITTQIYDFINKFQRSS